MRGVLGMAAEATRAHFLAAAARAGVLEALAQGPLEEAALDTRLRVPAGAAGLRAWLEVGSALGEFRREGSSWALAGRLARTLAEERNDDLAAMLEEVTTLHARLLHEAPARLAERRPFTLADQDGAVIARSSRVLQPLIEEVVAEHVPREGPFRLLEVGCGSGAYLRFAAERNPALTALGLELQPEVAAEARANLDAWRVGPRVQVEAQDLRRRPAEAAFDLVTLHNNIYYFPAAERVAVLRHAAAFLVRCGRLLLTTACPGGSPSGAVLHLWGELTEGCGGLPAPEALCAQLREAGLSQVACRNLAAPVEHFFAFTGTKTG
ncbi:MAG: methyltransferase domain-containing protein [Myxococcaceae bacterium]|nr:methyltransferase domain-containing protein [Myxococcaceae bacterium]